MAASKTLATKVELNPMELMTIDFTIKGTSPLIVHAWSHKVMQQMIDKQTGKAKKAKHDIKVPIADFIQSMYWLTDMPDCDQPEEKIIEDCKKAVENGAKFGFPLTGIKQSFISGAARGGLDVKMTELRGSFFLQGATDASTNELAEIISDAPVMREDMVMVGGMSKVADVRYRGEFRNWSIPLKLTYNKNGKYSLEQLLQCVNHGGFVTGIGEWRPEKDGQNGMYRLA